MMHAAVCWLHRPRRWSYASPLPAAFVTILQSALPRPLSSHGFPAAGLAACRLAPVHLPWRGRPADLVTSLFGPEATISIAHPPGPPMNPPRQPMLTHQPDFSAAARPCSLQHNGAGSGSLGVDSLPYSLKP